MRRLFRDGHPRSSFVAMMAILLVTMIWLADETSTASAFVAVQRQASSSSPSPCTATRTTLTRTSQLQESSSSSSSFSTLADLQQEREDQKPTPVLSKEEQLAAQKKALLDLLLPSSSREQQQEQFVDEQEQAQGQGKVDPILVDPLTKEPLIIAAKPERQPSSSSSISSAGVVFGGRTTFPRRRRRGGGGNGNAGRNVQFTSPSNVYAGNTQTFYNLLEPQEEDEEESDDEPTSDDENAQRQKRRQQRQRRLLRSLTPLVPPPLRFLTAATGLDTSYVPMRDLFTSPAVSFAYERGWRQNFATAGFPGPDREAELAMEFFESAFAKNDGGNDGDASTDPQMIKSPGTLVDMSCATGLFTRRFAKSGKYARVLGCDYSESMLTEARRRINADNELSTATNLDLIRLDVGQLPFANNSITALHAGAAMHCWPDLPKAASEIYRVLKPNGGKYFATTFLSNYFRLTQMGGSSSSSASADSMFSPGAPSQEAFQYFESTDQLRDLLIGGGFDPEKIDIEVLGAACVVIRCEK